MTELTTTLRGLWRKVSRKPAESAVIIVTIALGIGATTATFGVFHAVRYAPLPYADESRLVTVWTAFAQRDRAPISEAELVDLREAVASFSAVAAYRGTDVNLTGNADPQRLSAASTTANLFDVFGVQPAAGRFFEEGADRPGAEDVVVLAHSLWQRRFGGDRLVIGSTVMVDEIPHRVIGVAGPDFRLPDDFAADRTTEMWLPLRLDPDAPGARDRRMLTAVARLAPGTDVAAASAELSVLAHRYIGDGAVTDPHYLLGLNPVRERIFASVRPMSVALFLAAALVLLIAFVNVVNLLMTVMDSRRRELAVHAALGASRNRISLQLMMECAALVSVGGAAGLALAAAAFRVLPSLVPGRVPGLDMLAVDATIFVFAAATTLSAAVVVGVIPARNAARGALATTLRSAGRGPVGDRKGQNARRGLVLAQVAISVVVVIGAALLARTFVEMRNVDLGFDARNVLTFQVTLPHSAYRGDAPVVNFYSQLSERIAHLPEVRGASATALLPLVQPTGDWGIDISGRVRDPAAGFQGYLQVVTPGYFETMGMHHVSGRMLLTSDDATAEPVVVINERMVARYWPDGNVVGQRIRIRTDDEGPWFTVVGVVGDIRHNGIIDAPRHEMYFPHAQLPLALGGTTAAMSIVVRTHGDPLSLAAAIRNEVSAMDTGIPVANMRTMDGVVASALAAPRFVMLLFGAFGAIALLLAAVGIYGVLAYSVAQRQQEIGVRMALGARAVDIVRMVLSAGMTLVVAGVAIGLVAAFGLSRLMAGLLYGVSPTDAVTFAAVPLLLLCVALAAAYVPARRAVRIAPVEALRND